MKFVLTILLLLTACSAQLAPAGYAECPICKENGDLACLYVKAEEKSIHANINNKEYYFCSEECKQSFLKRHSENFRD